jgi:hypothetical protein
MRRAQTGCRKISTWPGPFPIFETKLC